MKTLPHQLNSWLAILALILSPAISLQAADTFSSVYISEFLADNQRGLLDGDGERSGWLELYNGGRMPVSLTGWYLTDQATNLTKWRLPRVGLLPDKYLLVFASGKARTNHLAPLHTNFRLNPQGGYLALVDPKTNVISEFHYPKQTPDISFGRVRGEPSLRGPFQRPTPGKPNATRGTGMAPEVVFSHPSGPFREPFTLQLSTRSPGAVIRYTLNGALPTTNSPLYSAPFLITNTTHLRARAYQDNLLPGPPQSQAYLLLHSNVLNFTSTLPVLVLDTFGKNSPAGSRSVFVHLSVYEPVKGKTSLTNKPTLITRGGFHTRGSSSAGMPQPSFAMEFLDEFNDEHDQPILGLPADSDWVLYAPNNFDPIMIHNPFAHQLSRDMGCYSPRTRFVEVFLVESPGPVSWGNYYGIYVLEEKIKISKHRVNIDRLGPDDLNPPEVTGGYVVKIDRTGPGEAGFHAAGASMAYVEPKEAVITLPQRMPQRHYLDKYFNEFDRVLNGPNWKDPVLGYRAFVDVDAWIDFHVLEVLSGNVDACNLSTYLYKPRNGKITFGPHWDFDRALGSTDGRDADPEHWDTGPYFGGPWWPRLFSDVDFWQRWVDRWQELRLTHFSLTHLHGLVDRLTDELREAQPRQVRKWGLHPRGGSYQSEIYWMKKWLSNRVDFIDSELVPPPRLSHAGGRIVPGTLVNLTAPTNSTIYYSLDGSDPRLSQGLIASNALVYAGPITLRSNVWLRARSRNPNQRQRGGPPISTPWSGPVDARYVVE